MLISLFSLAPKSLFDRLFAAKSSWFPIGLLVIFFISLALRFWGLGRFNTLVFDEVYYAKFAGHFLQGDLIFSGHPPLSTYIIAVSIWLSQFFPVEGEKNGLTSLVLSPISYRWLNALTGSFIPLVTAAIAYQLSHRRSFALIAAALIAADGLFLVESRYALNNVYLVLFGLLGHLGFLLALGTRSRGVRWLWLILAGAGFGGSAAIKWNGLGFLLGAGMIWAIGWGLHWLQPLWSSTRTVQTSPQPLSQPLAQTQPEPPRSLPLQRMTQMHLGHVAFGFTIIPAIVYYLSWIPYMQLDPTNNFWQLQSEILGYHERVGGIDAHPYCSYWYSWPLMLRPIAYFYQVAHAVGEPPPIVGPPLPGNAAVYIYDVHAMGNPILWWFSTAAILLLGVLLLTHLGQWVTAIGRRTETGINGLPQFGPRSWIVVYLLVNWCANLLPWVKVTRCIFIYHYMGSLVFAILALALLIDRWLQSTQPWQRTIGIATLVSVFLAFVFWMPMYLGLPLSPEELQARRWLETWI